MMTRCALYARVSSSIQAREGDSIPAQIDALNKYAKEHKFQISGTFIDDGISGTKNDRDELQNLLRLVEADKVDLILFCKLDRWFRSIRHYINTQAILDAHHVDWLAIWEPVYDTTTPAGRLIVNQMMSIAQFEAENTGQRIRQVQAYKVQNREVISGKVTPGFRIEGKHYVLDPDKVDAVKVAFDTFHQTGSLRATLRATEGTGLPKSPVGMKQMLSREIYTGRAHGLDDFAPRIVDDETFDAVQNQMKHVVKSSVKHDYIFNGLIVCAECGRVMSGIPSRMKGKVVERYRCMGYYGRVPHMCTNKKVVTQRTLEQELIAQLPDLIIQHIEVTEAERKPVIDLENQKKSLKRKIDRLKDLYVNDLIDMDEYKADKERLLAELESIPDAPEPPQKPTEVLTSLVGMNIGEIYQTFDIAEKRLFWRSVLERIRFDQNRNFFFDFK